MLVHLQKILTKAKEGGYAIGAFNVFNLETAKGVARAAVAKKSPVIIQVSESTIEYAGLKPITHIVSTIAKNEANGIPVVLHLDHGRSFRSATECIEAGFTSIMIDASDLPFDENAALTGKVVEYARKRGVAVQGELGRIRGKEGSIKTAVEDAVMTDPDEAAQFVKKTKVDTLAVSVGNMHGVAKLKSGVPRLDLERLKAISERVRVPLVLHGASGIPAAQIRRAMALGVRIINIDSELRVAFSGAARNALVKNRKEADPRKILGPAVDALQKVVENKIEVFGSSGRI